MPWTFLTNVVDKTPSTTGAWVDVSVAANVPAGTKAVLLKVMNTTGTEYYYGIRPKGSSETWTGKITSATLSGYAIAIVKLDSSYVFQAYIGNAGVKIYLWGYTNEDICFLNPYDKSTGTTNAWVDVANPELPAGARGAIYEHRNTDSSAGHYHYLRPKGSTAEDGTGGRESIYSHQWAIIGLDGNRYAQQKIDNTYCKLYLWGHAGSDYYPFTNPVDITPSATGWSTVDLSSYIPAGSTGVSLLFVNTSTSTNYKADARKTGSTDNHPSLTYGTVIAYNNFFRWVVVGVDSQRRVDIYSESTAVRVYLWGYFWPGKAVQFDVSSAASSTLERQLEAKRELITPSSTVSAELQALKVVAISLSVSGEALSSLSRVLQAARTFTVSSEAIAQLQRRIAAARTFTVTAGVSTTLQALITKFVTLSVATKPQTLIEVAKTYGRKFSVTTRPYAFLKVKGKEEICGLPDYILDFNLRMQSLGQLRVDIAACSIGTLNVNIVGQIGTLNVNVTNSSLNVNITNSSLNVNVTNSSLNVNITNAQINANITNAQVNVSGVGGYLSSVYYEDLLLKQGRIATGCAVQIDQGWKNIYTVPSGYVFYLLVSRLSGYSSRTGSWGAIGINVYDADLGSSWCLCEVVLAPSSSFTVSQSYPAVLRFKAGSYFEVGAVDGTVAEAGIIGRLVSASLEKEILRKAGFDEEAYEKLMKQLEKNKEEVRRGSECPALTLISRFRKSTDSCVQSASGK
ncbi:MAG: hypothetical protein QXX81_08375 [Zestosphaera sp.]